MKKHSKLFSTLLVFLLCLDLVAPVAQAMASTDGQVDGFTGLEASPSYEADGGETVENTAVVSQEEPTTEQNDQQVTVDTNTNETAVHPTEQTQGEIVQQENTATQVTIDSQEEEVVEEPSLEEDEAREIQSGGKLIPVNITDTSIIGDKDFFDDGDEIGINLKWNITPGTSVQEGDYFTVSYPHFLEAVKSSFTMNHGTCETSNGLVTCTFDDRVNGLDNIHGGLEFGGKLVVEKGTGKQTVSLTVNGQLVKDIVLDGGNSEPGGVINQLVDKMGTRADDKHLNWIITLNGDKSADTVKLTDKPNQGHKIIPESMVISVQDPYTGPISLSYSEFTGSGLVQSHSITAEQIYLELALSGRLAAISYQTEIVSENVKEWSNNVYISADTHSGNVEESESAKVEKFGGAWSQGELAKYRGSFTVVKTDEAGTPLQGATFNLKDNEGNVVQTFTTDENGQATIADIAGGHYTLVETAAPAGYLLNTEAIEVTLKFDQNQSHTTTVVNEKAPENVCTDFTVTVYEEVEENGVTVKKPLPSAKVTINSGANSIVSKAEVDENGKYVHKQPLNEYVVTAEAEGYVSQTVKGTTTKENCGTEVILVKAEPTPEPELCENFTVSTEDGSTVTITDKETNTTFETGEVADGKFITVKPLEPGKDYTVTVEKDGYETVTKDVKGSEENCEITVELTEVPAKDVCENFTVNTEDGSTVTITDKETNTTFETGEVADGKFITVKPLEPGKDYTVTVEKDGYETETKEVTGSEDDCEITVELTEVPAKDVCENFTVNTEDGSTVTITDKETNATFETSEVESGKFVTAKPLEPGKDYTVTVEKDGYETATEEVTGSKNDCETTIDLVEVPAEKEVCENFTVTVAEKEDAAETKLIEDAQITIKDAAGGVFATGKTDANGQFVTEQPLTVDETYTVIVKKDGYETIEQTVTGSEDNCGTTIYVQAGEEQPGVVEEVCKDFTVNTKDGSKVTIKEKETNKVISEGTVEGGTFVTDKPLEPGKDYTVTVEKDGYKKETVKVTGSEDNCEITVELTEKPIGGGGGGSPDPDPKPDPTPEHPEKPEPEQPTEPTEPTPVDPVEPEQPETPGEEKPEPEQPTEPTPVDPVEPEQPETPGEDKPGVVEEVCKDFTVETERYAKVVIKDSEGNIFVEGKADKDGKFVTDKPLVKGETYTVKVTKTGYRKVEETVIGSETDCSIELPMKRRPSGGGGGGTPTEPSNPTDPGNEKDKPEVVEPETPGTETPGTETPGTETPGTETPETEAPGTETPGTETPETETPETEAPEVDEKDKPEVIENDKTSGKPGQPSVNEQDKPSVVDNGGSKTKPSVSKPGQNNSVQGETLPQTGEEQYILFLGLGLFLVLFGAGMTYRSRKQA